MDDETFDVIDAYDALERAIYHILPMPGYARRFTCGSWTIDIMPTDPYKLNPPMAPSPHVTDATRVRRLLDELKKLDGSRYLTELYDINKAQWSVEIMYGDEPSRRLKGVDYIAAYFARLHQMNDKDCNLILRSESTELTIRGAERRDRTMCLIESDPRGEVWEEAEAIASYGVGFQGTVIGDLGRKVVYSLRKYKTWLKQPSITVRDKNVVTHHEGRAVQVTEMPAMTVITLWKETNK